MLFCEGALVCGLTPEIAGLEMACNEMCVVFLWGHRLFSTQTGLREALSPDVSVSPAASDCETGAQLLPWQCEASWLLPDEAAKIAST